jgi:hypothetical protein
MTGGKITHQWITRGKCACGYLWTTPGAGDIICACGVSRIEGHVLASGEPVIDEAEFAAAVAADLGRSLEDITIEQVSA